MADDYRQCQSDFGSVASSSAAIGSSNIGFQLLKKHGWKEGTGLGASEQGRLEPVETHIKNNKRGLGSDEVKKKTSLLGASHDRKEKPKKEVKSLSKKEKAMSKRMRKMKEREEQLQEKEFERAFFREFWPDNV